MEKAKFNFNQFVSDLDSNNIETPNIIDEVIDDEEPNESFIYMIWSFGNKNTSHIHFYPDGEITLMWCYDGKNNGITLKEYDFKQIIEYLNLK